jgi:hypothetical protein
MSKPSGCVSMICRALRALTLTSCVIWLLTACSSGTLNHGSSVSSALDSFASAGLGLTKTEWEQKHTPVGSSPDGPYNYDELPSPTWKGMSVYFWSEQGAPFENAPISRIDLMGQCIRCCIYTNIQRTRDGWSVGVCTRTYQLSWQGWVVSQPQTKQS